MIYVLELPAGGAARAWFAFDDDDLLRKVAQDDPLQPWEIWDRSSARELLSLFDDSPGAPGVQQRLPGICAIAAEHGWDTPLYRADHLLGRGQFRAEPVSPAQACSAALSARGVEHRLWPGIVQAVLALEAEADPLWQQAEGWRARLALREQLLATEALAEG